jgi:hypothetical protein
MLPNYDNFVPSAIPLGFLLACRIGAGTNHESGRNDRGSATVEPELKLLKDGATTRA